MLCMALNILAQYTPPTALSMQRVAVQCHATHQDSHQLHSRVCGCLRQPACACWQCVHRFADIRCGHACQLACWSTVSGAVYIRSCCILYTRSHRSCCFGVWSVAAGPAWDPMHPSHVIARGVVGKWCCALRVSSLVAPQKS